MLDAGVEVFARAGYAATPVTDVAAAAEISQGYVLRLFKTKLNLFVAVLGRCYERICATLAAAADAASGQGPDQVLEAMGDAYAELIADRSLLMLQVHAQSAADEPAVRQAMRDGVRAVVDLAQERTGADDDQIQRFIAYGQLCHLIVTADLDSTNARWARVLTHGMRHVPTKPRRG